MIKNDHFTHFPTYEELQQIEDKELIELYSNIANKRQHQVNSDFYLLEYYRRINGRINDSMLKVSKSMRNLTWFIILLTLCNLFLVGYSIFF